MHDTILLRRFPMDQWYLEFLAGFRVRNTAGTQVTVNSQVRNIAATLVTVNRQVRNTAGTLVAVA